MKFLVVGSLVGGPMEYCMKKWYAPGWVAVQDTLQLKSNHDGPHIVFIQAYGITLNKTLTVEDRQLEHARPNSEAQERGLSRPICAICRRLPNRKSRNSYVTIWATVNTGKPKRRGSWMRTLERAAMYSLYRTLRPSVCGPTSTSILVQYNSQNNDVIHMSHGHQFWHPPYRHSLHAPKTELPSPSRNTKALAHMVCSWPLKYCFQDQGYCWRDLYYLYSLQPFRDMLHIRWQKNSAPPRLAPFWPEGRGSDTKRPQ